MNLSTYNPIDDFKKETEEMIEYSKKISEKWLEENSLEQEESFYGKMDKNNDTLKEIAESAKSQANSAEIIANNAEKQANAAIDLSEEAKKISEIANIKSEKAKRKVNWSLIIALISCIGTLIANADKILYNLQKILDCLGLLK